LISVEPRFMEVLYPPLLALCAHALLILAEWAESRRPEWGPFRLDERTLHCLMLFLAITFAAPCLRAAARDIVKGWPGIFRSIASRLKEKGCPGPIACSDWHYGLYVAYHMDELYLGVPGSQTGAAAAAELAAHGVGTYLFWTALSCADAQLGAGWVEVERADTTEATRLNMLRAYIRGNGSGGMGWESGSPPVSRPRPEVQATGRDTQDRK
ncbi:MAG: hypothetical protein N3A38_02475, partial [Planctomycetota bacterium]|nr:hypothetical protein [Planctomycetota bacterium]